MQHMPISRLRKNMTEMLSRSFSSLLSRTQKQILILYISHNQCSSPHRARFPWLLFTNFILFLSSIFVILNWYIFILLNSSSSPTQPSTFQHTLSSIRPSYMPLYPPILCPSVKAKLNRSMVLCKDQIYWTVEGPVYVQNWRWHCGWRVCMLKKIFKADFYQL